MDTDKASGEETESEHNGDMDDDDGGGDDDGSYQDECHLCKGGGQVVCCDYCPKAFHLACVSLKVSRTGAAASSSLPKERSGGVPQ